MTHNQKPVPQIETKQPVSGTTTRNRANSPLVGTLDTYRDEWDTLRPLFDEAIEGCRKSDVLLEILDAAGRPIPHAEVAIHQTKHAFSFGSNALMLGQFSVEGDNERYEEAFARLFNLATTTFCWSEIEPAPGELRFEEGSREIFRRPPPDRVVAFAKRNGITLKGQPLLADSWFPKWAPRDPTLVKRLYSEYFARVAERYGREFTLWDVVNEALLCPGRSPDFPLFSPSLEYVAWAFKEALHIFPAESGLEINESTEAHTSLRDKYFAMVNTLVNQGVSPRAIGFQFHMFTPDTLKEHLQGNTLTLPELRKTYRQFSSFGLPLYISEITVPSTLGDRRRGEMIQAEVLQNLYRFWFSVPQIAGIIHWNLADGPAWQNEGDLRAGLLDGHLREKPAYMALDQLINRDWRTHFSGATDTTGRVSFRGFHGTYTATIKACGNTCTFNFKLSNGSSNHVRFTV